ncbi:MAG: four helix bundle protein [Gelidibacter sp.]|uniref:four helix bundle protein n=1 Tax=Gelidibacter sp. TaxID=2018083 RepID=UPI0032660035
MKISRKEAKESKYWLRLIKATNEDFLVEIEKLIIEAEELRQILSAIINKVQ